MNLTAAPNELIEELDAGMRGPREIEFHSSDMYVVYRTIREFPEGLKQITQNPGVVGRGDGS